VRAFRQKLTFSRSAIGSHAFDPLEASRRVANAIPLGCPLFSPVHTVNCVQTLKADDVNLWETELAASFVVGETSPITFSLAMPLPDENEDEISSLAVNFGDSDDAFQVTVFTVRNKLMRLTEGVYTAKPLLLDPFTAPFVLTGGLTRRFSLEVTALLPGCHQGAVMIQFKSGGMLAIPLAFSVSDVNLATIPSNIEVGFLGLTPQLPGTPFPESVELGAKGAAASVELLHGMGVTGISGGIGPPQFRGYDDDGVIMDFTRADATMKLLDEYWPVSNCADVSSLLFARERYDWEYTGCDHQLKRTPANVPSMVASSEVHLTHIPTALGMMTSCTNTQAHICQQPSEQHVPAGELVRRHASQRHQHVEFYMEPSVYW
jgi:hypothetical protein